MSLAPPRPAPRPRPACRFGQHPRMAATILLACVALATTACQPATPPSGGEPSAEPGEGEAIVIGQQGTICFGTCPEYKLILRSDGSAEYQGGRFAPREGYYEAEVDPAVVAALAQSAEDMGYFDLEDDYDEMVTDVPTTFSYLQVGDRRKAIRDRFGAPDALHAYEQEVYETAETLDWQPVATPQEDPIWEEEGFASWVE